MCRTILRVLAILLWSFPTVSLAMTVQIYDLRAGKVNATWNGIGSISMEQRPDGLLLTTGSATGVLVTQVEPPFLADMGDIVLSSDKDIHAAFVWSFRSSLQDITQSVPIDIDTESKNTHRFSLSHHPEWRAGPKNFGVLFPPTRRFSYSA